MPVPEGQITGSQIWQGESVDLNQYEVVTTYKVRKRTVVSATDEAAAQSLAEDLFDSNNPSNYDELVSDYTIKVKEA